MLDHTQQGGVRCIRRATFDLGLLDEATLRGCMGTSQVFAIGSVRRYFLSLIVKLRREFYCSAGFVVPLALWWLWRHHRAAAADKERLTAVVKSVLAKLIEQARNHAHNPAAPPYLASVRLRDELLYDEQTLSYRQRIWGRVEKVIGINSNVRTSLEEMGDGDEMIVWTWIGSL